MNANERNRTIAHFEHNGKHWRIHQRSNRLSDTSWGTRRFIINEDGNWAGWARNIKEARRVLDARVKDHQVMGYEDLEEVE